MDCLTKYIKMRRCIQCWHINEGNLNRCNNCNYLFIGEATEEEAEKRRNDYNNT
jgi:hypothetical protein